MARLAAHLKSRLEAAPTEQSIAIQFYDLNFPDRKTNSVCFAHNWNKIL
jgi:hypothetical protein